MIQRYIDSLSESSHDRLNRLLFIGTFVVSIPLALVLIPYVAGLILLFVQ